MPNYNKDVAVITAELQTIINELDDIYSQLKASSKGIGNIKCANEIKNVADNYRKAKRTLNSVDYSDCYIAGGGGGGF